jgi:ribosome-associated toxin RatA of RatAB toxin-antitoxin module
MRRYAAERVVDAPADVVWGVIADLERYADFAPNLAKTEVLSGQGEGLVRRCTDVQGGTWTETCALWEEGRRYTMVVDTSTYPYPMSHMQGTWGVDERADGTAITIQFEYGPRYDLPLIGGVMNAMMVRPSMERLSQKLLDNWEAEIVCLPHEPRG